MKYSSILVIFDSITVILVIYQRYIEGKLGDGTVIPDQI